MPRRSNLLQNQSPSLSSAYISKAIECILGHPAIPEQFPKISGSIFSAFFKDLTDRDEKGGGLWAEQRNAINFLAYRDPTARHPKNKLTRGKQRKAGPRILLALRLVYHLFVIFGSSIRQMKKRDPSHISQAIPGHLPDQVQKTPDTWE